MIKVYGLTPGRNVPSARFRIHQFSEPLQSHDISLQEADAPISYDKKLPGVLGRVRQRFIFPISGAFYGTRILSRVPQIIKSHTCDLAWLNRPLVDGIFLEKFLKRPFVFDVDDAIWMNGESHCRKIAIHADCIFAGNTYLANWFSQHNKNVQLIPTAIDVQRFRSTSGNISQKTFNIVWSGSSQTESYLLNVEGALSNFLARHPDARLKVVSNTMPAFKTLNRQQVDFNNWNAKTEVEILEGADVGIMPLRDGEWEKGKCSFKMLQYMSMSLPVVVSPVGMNKDVLSKAELGIAAKNDSEWVDALETLCREKNLAKKMGDAGRKVVTENFSTDVVATKIAGHFKNLLN